MDTIQDALKLSLFEMTCQLFFKSKIGILLLFNLNICVCLCETFFFFFKLEPRFLFSTPQKLVYLE